MARRATYIKSHSHSGEHVLILETGDFNGGRGSREKLKSEFILRSFALLNYDAITPGERDFLHGVNFLLEMQKQYKLPFVSANIFYAENNKPVFAPYLIKELKKIKHGDTTIPKLTVGIFGVMLYRDQLFLGDGEPNLVVGDPIEAAQQVVARIKDKCDILICLAHLRYTELKLFADAVPEVDVFFSGHDPVMRMQPENLNRAISVVGGNKGQYIGDLRLIIKDKNILDYEGKLTALDEKFSDDPDMLTLISEFKDKELTLTYHMNHQQNQRMDMYSGTETCKKCHESQYNQWQKTGHARAFQRLLKEKQQQNYNCLPCHTTGFARFNGFYTYKDTPEMVNIQCEACHGTGKTHVATAEKMDNKKHSRGMLAPIVQHTCTNCHTTERDPDFDFKNALEKVKH
ncbi:MAG: multiheme c-type cytochrome [Candidatus Zhuqueibacterota bacterium]